MVEQLQVDRKDYFSLSKWLDIFTQWLRSEGFDRREFLVLFVLGVIANIYFLSTFSPSIDDELAALRTDSSVWVAQGRFGVYLIERLLFPQPATPFAPYLVLVLCLVVAYMLLVRAHGYAVSWKTYASFPIFVTFPTWWLISEFSANVPSTGFGFLLVALATYLAHDGRNPSLFRRVSIRRGLGIVALLAFAAGTYQSLLVVFLSMAVGITLAKCLRSSASDKELAAAMLREIAQVGTCLGAAGILYFVLAKGAQAVIGVQAEYISNFVHPENLMTPVWVFGAIARQALGVYSGSAAIFGAGMPIAGLVLIMACACVLLSSGRKIILHAFLLLALFGTPFVLHVLTLSPTMPMRSMLALPYVTWLIAMLVLGCSRVWLGIVSSVLLGLYQLQIVNLTSQYIAAASVTQAYDRMIATDIGRRLLELSAADQSGASILLDVYGYREQEITSVYAAAPSSATKGSFFGWDKGNINRITAYMTILGFAKVKSLTDAERRMLTQEFSSMPIWPLAGSIKRIGPHYLVKLGTQADKVHAP